MTTELELNQEQLELLQDPKMFDLLAVFIEPKSASDAARTLGLAANTIHYRAKKLLALNLIIELESKTKVRILQAVAESFLIPESLMPSMPSLMPQMLGTMMDDLKNKLINSAEQHVKNNLVNAIKDKPGFHLTKLQKQNPQPHNYPAELRLLTLNLSSTSYLAMQHDLIEVLNKYQSQSQENSSLRDCSVNLICFAV